MNYISEGDMVLMISCHTIVQMLMVILPEPAPSA